MSSIIGGQLLLKNGARRIGDFVHPIRLPKLQTLLQQRDKQGLPGVQDLTDCHRYCTLQLRDSVWKKVLSVQCVLPQRRWRITRKKQDILEKSCLQRFNISVNPSNLYEKMEWTST